MAKQSFERRNFTRDLMAVALLFSLILFGVVAYFTLQAKRDISEQSISDASQLAAEKLSGTRASLETSLEQVREYGTSGLLSLANTDHLKKLFLPILQKRLLAGITLADAQGRSYFLLPDGSEQKRSNPNEYDPRERPWYRPALAQDMIYWTRPYTFHTLQQIGITASVAFQGPKDKDRSVVAFDILLNDLDQEIREMAPSENSQLFTFHQTTTGEPIHFSLTDPDSSPLIKAAFSLWQKDSLAKNEIGSFLYEGSTWWCGFHALDAETSSGWIGVIVPESDIVGDVSRRRTFLWSFGLVSVILSLGLAAGISHRYGAALPMNPLDAAESPERILGLIALGENRSVEFKSTLRMNLHSKKPGKEIELAWLKGVAAFLNTDGGTLLLGVTDDGEITGLERDVFENEDKCRLHFKNLIATHLGAEHSKYIRFRLLLVGEKTVGVVHCSCSLEPVFLKNGNKEAFYIRNGPSSDELPVSKALHYIKQRS